MINIMDALFVLLFSLLIFAGGLALLFELLSERKSKKYKKRK